MTNTADTTQTTTPDLGGSRLTLGYRVQSTQGNTGAELICTWCAQNLIERTTPDGVEVRMDDLDEWETAERLTTEAIPLGAECVSCRRGGEITTWTGAEWA